MNIDDAIKLLNKIGIPNDASTVMEDNQGDFVLVDKNMENSLTTTFKKCLTGLCLRLNIHLHQKVGESGSLRVAKNFNCIVQ